MRSPATDTASGRALAPPAVGPAIERPLAIEVRDLHKTFRIPTQRLDTLKERFVRGFRAPPHRELRALNGVSFDVERGEFFGVAGRNGSGKSTLLKLLASIYRADSGTIRVGGRMAPFLELGVGFNQELSARENVVINGVMMGLTPREARHRFDSIMDFAELGGFADLKLKNYSSGMMVRLGFALMTQVDADVLLVDEVLAVGDASFQQRCFDAFARLHGEGRTIVLVSHDMNAIDNHCDRALLLEDGKVEQEGEPGDVARRYLELNFERQGVTARPRVLLSGAIKRLEARILDPAGEPTHKVEQGTPVRIDASMESGRTIEDPLFSFQIANAEGQLLFATRAFGIDGVKTLRAGERVRLGAEIRNTFAADHYFVHLALARNSRDPEWIAFRKNATDFQVFGTMPFAGLIDLDCDAGAGREGGN